MEENPWNNYEALFIEGKDYEGTVREFFDKGALIQMEHNIEAFAPIRHLEKEDGSNVGVGETLQFRVLEFSKENRKIIVSHTSIFKKEIAVERKKQATTTKKVMKKIQSTQQQSTLGDLDELTNLKKNLKESE